MLYNQLTGLGKLISHSSCLPVEAVSIQMSSVDLLIYLFACLPAGHFLCVSLCASLHVQCFCVPYGTTRYHS